MDSTRRTQKLIPDPAIESGRQTPSAGDNPAKPRESLIEAAMEVAMRNVSRRLEVFEAQPMEAALLRRPEMRESSRVWGKSSPEEELPLEPQPQVAPKAREIRSPENEIPGPELKIEPERNVSLADVAEHCERLRAHISTRYPGEAMKVILFVGIASGSGVSTAAANFAASLAQDAESKVLLMDANFRSAKRQESDAANEDVFNRIDLAHLLDDPMPVCPAPGPSNLYILPRGKPTSMPLSLFQSDAFDCLLQKLGQHFRYVIIDGPPLQDYPESVVLSRKADGVILVVESEKARKRTAVATKEQIEGAGGKLLGVVLNRRKYYIPDWLYRRI